MHWFSTRRVGEVPRKTAKALRMGLADISSSCEAHVGDCPETSAHQHRGLKVSTLSPSKIRPSSTRAPLYIFFSHSPCTVWTCGCGCPYLLPPPHVGAITYTPHMMYKCVVMGVLLDTGSCRGQRLKSLCLTLFTSPP